MTIRFALPADAEAIHAIYAPIVASTVISFELDVPTVDEMRLRIATTLARLPWLVSTDEAGWSTDTSTRAGIANAPPTNGPST